MTNINRIFKEASGYRRSSVILTAVRAGLFDLLIDVGCIRAGRIGGELGWTHRGTEIMLNALTSLGYLEKQGEEYCIAEKHREFFLNPDYPLFKQRLLHQWRLMQRWVQLDRVLKTGQPVSEPGEIDRQANLRNFILAMAQGEKLSLPGLLAAVSLEGCRHLLDLGGGPGLFSIGFAEKYSGLQATVFDRPEVEPIAREFFDQSPAKARLYFRSGDLLSDLPGSDYDAVLISSILHIFSPRENLNLLKRVFRAALPGAIIIVRDFLLNRAKTAPPDAALFAVNMLVNTEKGNAYSAAEIRNWLKTAGFKNIRRIPLNRGAGLLVAEK